MSRFYNYKLMLNDTDFNLDYTLQFQNQIGDSPLLFLSLINSRELIKDNLQAPNLKFLIDNVVFFDTTTSIENVTFRDNGTTNFYEYSYTYDALKINKKRILPQDPLPFVSIVGEFKDDYIAIAENKVITPNQYYDILENVALQQDLGLVYANSNALYTTKSIVSSQVNQNIIILKAEIFNNLLRAYLQPNIFIDIRQKFLYNKVIYTVNKVILSFSTERGINYWVEASRNG